MNIVFERWYPLVYGLFLGVLTFFVFQGQALSSRLTDLLAATMSLSGIAIGFLATVKSILFSIEDRKIIKNLKQTNKFNTLIDYIMDAINGSFLSSILSGIGLLIDWESYNNWKIIFISSWMATLLTSGFCCYRVIKLFQKILKS